MEKFNKKKYGFMTFGLLLFLVGEFLFFIQNEQIQKQEQMEMEKIQNFMENPQSFEISEDSDYITTSNFPYIAILEIPKIHLKKGIFDVNSTQNDVNYNIQMIQNSDYPNIENGNMILAGHSGIGRATYFNHLNQLDLKDSIFVYYQGIKYIYQVNQIYEVEKTGKVGIKRDDTTATLTLITCHFRTNQQLVVIAKQIKQEPM